MTKPLPKPLKAIIAIVAILVIATMLTALYFIAPTTDSFFPKCMFHQFTGFNCPGCGLQRAIHALMHGHVAEAVSYNALLPVMALLLALYAMAYALRDRYPAAHRLANSPALAWVTVVLIFGWWVLRNLLGI